jgi:geranylgeranyl diphosphate synthase type II
VANPSQRRDIRELLETNPADKVSQMLSLFRQCGVDAWANELKEKYISSAFQHLDDIAVLSVRKTPLKELADFLMQRDY